MCKLLHFFVEPVFCQSAWPTDRPTDIKWWINKNRKSQLSNKSCHKSKTVTSVFVNLDMTPPPPHNKESIVRISQCICRLWVWWGSYLCYEGAKQKNNYKNVHKQILYNNINTLHIRVYSMRKMGRGVLLLFCKCPNFGL